MSSPDERRRRLAGRAEQGKRKGKSNRAIGDVLGIDRRTVAKLLAELEARRAEGMNVLDDVVEPPRVPRASKLDRYDADIRQWLKDYPDMTAERVLEDLQKKGYDGGHTIVRARVSALRPVEAKAAVSAVMDYACGQRAEFDWSPYLIGATKDVAVSVWNAQLCWSGVPTPRACANQKQTTNLRCLQWSLEKGWGGVPEEILTDTMPGVVDRWEGGEPVLNARFVDFAAHYGFTTLIAPRRCPKYKARVERKFRFIEQNALNGRTFASIAELDAFLAEWTTVKVLARRHPRDTRTIGERLVEERTVLRPLPSHPYDTRDVTSRVVNGTGHVPYQTNEYPVPDAEPGDRVYLVIDEQRVLVCSAQAKVLVEHERLDDGRHIQLPQLSGMRAPRRDLERISERLGAWHEDAARFVRGVRDRSRQAAWILERVLTLQASWAREDIVEAMRRLMLFGCYELKALERVLAARFAPRSLPEIMAERSLEQIRGVIETHPISPSPRPLDGYERLQHGDDYAPAVSPGDHDA